MTIASHNGSHVGILVGGGPAPGINGVISAITLEARTRARKVIGYIADKNGKLFTGDPDKFKQKSQELFGK